MPGDQGLNPPKSPPGRGISSPFRCAIVIGVGLFSLHDEHLRNTQY
jgi:hypothetical protein